MQKTSGEWWNDPAVAWLAWGILNPFGPTLNVLGMKKDGPQQRTFLRTLHFSGGSTVEGDLYEGPRTLEDIFEQAAKIDQFLRESGEGSIFSSIPSFVLCRQDDPSLKQLFAALLTGFGGLELDWDGEISAVRKFETEFWERASHDMADAFQPENSRPARIGESPEKEFDWWLETITSNEFSRSAFQSFIAMWQGASGQAPGLAKVTELEVLQFLLKADLLSERFFPRMERGT